MAKEKQFTEEQEQTAELHTERKPMQATAEYKYVGPVPAPNISNVPGMQGSAHADDITNPGFIRFIIDTVPAAIGWWAPA